jgi:hypothetical protein
LFLDINLKGLAALITLKTFIMLILRNEVKVSKRENINIIKSKIFHESLKYAFSPSTNPKDMDFIRNSITYITVKQVSKAYTARI